MMAYGLQINEDEWGVNICNHPRFYCSVLDVSALAFIVWQRNWPDVRFAYCLSMRGCSVRHLMQLLLRAMSCPPVYDLGVYSSCVFCYLF